MRSPWSPVSPAASFVAILVGLWLRGADVGVSSMMGMSILVGLVTEASGFYVEELRVLPPEMDRGEAPRVSAANRLRPSP